MFNKFEYGSLTLRFKWNFQCGLIRKYYFSVCRQIKRKHNKISIPILIDGFRLSRHFSFPFTVPFFSSVLLLALYRLHFTFSAIEMKIDFLLSLNNNAGIVSRLPRLLATFTLHFWQTDERDCPIWRWNRQCIQMSQLQQQQEQQQINALSPNIIRQLVIQ